jgi:PKD repeat protein
MRNQKSWKLLLVFLLLGIFCINFASAVCTDGSCSGDPSRDGIMHFDMETMKEMSAQQQNWLTWDENNIPNAASSPEPHPAGVYSLLPHITYVTTDRDQGSCGNCWAWAGTGVMEVDHDIQTGINDRFSLQWLNSRLNNGGPANYACCGGGLGGVATFYTTYPNAIRWANTNGDFIDDTHCCGSTTCVNPWDRAGVAWGSIGTTPNYPITSISTVNVNIHGNTVGSVTQAQAITRIKNTIDANRAVYFAFGLPTDASWYGGAGSGSFSYYWNHGASNSVYDIDQFAGQTWDGNCNDGNGCGGSHAVLLVGYDDSVPGSEYWILLNSWGDAGGNRPDGLWRIPWNMDYSTTYADGSGGLLWAFSAATLDITWTPVVNNPPHAEANGDYLAILGTPAIFDSTGSNDPEGGPITYLWAFGNGATSTQANPNYIYPTAAHYTATLTVTDFLGATGSDTANVVVDRRPFAEANGPYPSLFGNPIAFNSGGSNDPDSGDSLTAYEWSARTPPSTGTWNVFSNAADPSYTLPTAADYDIQLRVMDNHNVYSNYDTTTAYANRPPHAEANGPYNTIVGQTVTFSSTGTNDPDPGDILTYDWNWGDATAHGSGASPTHAYATGGTKTVTLTVTDNHGATGTDTATVNVNVPPHAEANGPYAGSINQVITFSSASSTDPDGSIVSYDWNWGDGTAHGTGVSPTHPYTSAGTKTVTLTVTDNGPAVATGTDTATVNIRTPCEDINNLKAMVTGMTLTPTIRTALNTRLNKASTLCAKGPGQYPAIATLFKKDFIPYVNSKIGKGITPAQATTLLNQANLIIAACGG